MVNGVRCTVNGENKTVHSFTVHRSQRIGFSLVEVIIAIAVLAVGLLGAIRVFPVGLKASKRSELISRAALTAQRTIESLKLQSWDALADSAATEAPFTITVSVDRPGDTGLTSADVLKRVGVEVRWMQEDRPRNLTVVTYLRRPSS